MKQRTHAYKYLLIAKQNVHVGKVCTDPTKYVNFDKKKILRAQ